MARVIVGMSGGVDSAVTAYLLKRAGYDVVGTTLRIWESAEGQESRCCEIDDARHTAWKLGIQYYALNSISDFEKHVTEPFMDCYIAGKTPNPCVFCNRHVKWEKMLYFAGVMGADYIATGHYAYVIKLPNGRYTVKKALYAEKDQTYMLYRLSQEQLAKTLMPLGDYTKEQVRKLAREADLTVAEKADSQEICFVTDGNYADFIRDNAKAPIPGEGNFVSEDGEILGKHKGIIHYTVGQRKGLGLPLGYPAYVKGIHPDTNEVVISTEDSLYSREIICNDLNFLSIEGLKPGEKLSCVVKIRYHHQGAPATIEMIDDKRLKVTFETSVRAATPGQSAVFYSDEDYVIGGGVIDEIV
ncbi:MAG: tRNA 2-thiouridine(34) synthase MnmA [Lachnospiraceae bacterium]|nr:tRNA 2-thiouridine(34) synthase MnmA [Lachnospiraceae bacterium]